MYVKKTVMEEFDVLFSILNAYFSDAVRLTLSPEEIDFQIM